MTISLDDQIKAVQREIGMRKRVYPRWVENGKMTQITADKEMAAMEAVLETLKKVVDGRIFGERARELSEDEAAGCVWCDMGIPKDDLGNHHLDGMPCRKLPVKIDHVRDLFPG